MGKGARTGGEFQRARGEFPHPANSFLIPRVQLNLGHCISKYFTVLFEQQPTLSCFVFGAETKHYMYEKCSLEPLGCDLMKPPINMPVLIKHKLTCREFFNYCEYLTYKFSLFFFVIFVPVNDAVKRLQSSQFPYKLYRLI